MEGFKLYKIYFIYKDIKNYVKAIVLGGEPFVHIIPAGLDEEIGIFEEDKAKKYVELLNEENEIVEFYLEED